MTHMADVKVYYDRDGNPEDEYEAEETGEEVILMKDRHGHVIGFEKLNFSLTQPEPLCIAFETVAT